jgi:hypothetical protein
MGFVNLGVMASMADSPFKGRGGHWTSHLAQQNFSEGLIVTIHGNGRIGIWFNDGTFEGQAGKDPFSGSKSTAQHSSSSRWL